MALKPDDIKRVITRYYERLSTYREAINDLNVYPVPDGDTGTNMALTLGSVVQEISTAVSMEDLATGISHGSLMGARGNSGVILSQVLRGLADVFRESGEVDTSHLVDALDRASTAAYRAVQKPVEGTILTVLREAAEAARDAGTEEGTSLASLLTAVYERALDALARTPQMLPVLERAGVVDAGGAGLLLLISSFLEVVTGSEVSLPDRLLRAKVDPMALAGYELPVVSSLRFEVMFFLEAGESVIDDFREGWARVGDSIVIVGGEGTWNCHIHTDAIGPAVEAAIAVGRPYDIKVTDLREVEGHLEPGVPAVFQARPEALAAPVGVVSVVVGDGIARLFAELGAQGVVVGGQSSNPSTRDLLKAVLAVPAERVVLLPNNKNIIGVAEQVDALTEKNVEVVPTRNLPQGIAAMFGYAFMGDDLEQTAEDMAAAASSVLTGEITRAVRDAKVEFGKISRGDWIGIADGTIVVADRDLEVTLRGLVASILPPMAELMTIYTGNDASPAATKALMAWLYELHPGLEVREVYGGQPLYPYLVSVE